MTAWEKLQLVTAGMDHRELADRIGVCWCRFDQLLTGRAKLVFPEVSRLAKALNLSLDWLTDYTQGMPAKTPVQSTPQLELDALYSCMTEAQKSRFLAARSARHGSQKVHEPDGLARTGGGVSRRPLAGLISTTAGTPRTDASAHGNGRGTDAADASSLTNRPARPVGLPVAPNTIGGGAC